ncbi:MAG TPA: magnesium chelatase [Dehalococcoidia bacterium]|nr:magnesium chelatase [Dehalococcoidia bacterium]
MTTRPATLAELRRAEYRVIPIKAELRRNLIRKLSTGEELFPGIRGYDDTVIPQLQNAILAGQDIVMLGERGQAKSRLIRSLTSLLDDAIPAVTGCEINDNPYEPICRRCKDLIAAEGDATPVSWLTPEQRYSEKLATPDTSIADLIGEVDPIRVAEGRYLSDELTIHYGLIPRTHRGIFAINELPDLAERIQVGLLNIIEERDVQIRGYRLRLPLDVFVVASANPEDYTNRGRIITPLKDRFGTEIRTHYPRTVEHEVAIMESEAMPLQVEGIEMQYPDFMKEIVAEITHQARRSSEISQRSGVSVRVSITNYENVMSNAVRRAIRLKERQAVPRVSDLGAVVASTSGKIELDTIGEAKEDKVVEKLIRLSILKVFRDYFDISELDQLVAGFEKGLSVQVSDMQPAMEYVTQLDRVGGLKPAIQKLHGHGSPATVASAVEFLLEGLHLSKRLNKDEVASGQARYRR